jgi:hypothetical protein
VSLALAALLTGLLFGAMRAGFQPIAGHIRHAWGSDTTAMVHRHI